MKEYWINYYGKYGYGTSFDNRKDAVYYRNSVIKPEYFIHVKMKDKIGIENRYPYKFKDLIYSESRGIFDGIRGYHLKRYDLINIRKNLSSNWWD